jgi:hypothetical protein
VEELMVDFQPGPAADVEVIESIRLFGKQVIAHFRT